MCLFKGLCIATSMVFLLIPTSVKAETWVQLDERITIDTDSILMEENLRAYWMRFDNSPGFFMANEVVNCTTGKNQVMRIVVYNSLGRVVDDATYQPGEKTTYIVPGTKGSMVRNFVCQ